MTPSPIESRLAALEEALARLTAELAAIRNDVRASESVESAAPAAARPLPPIPLPPPPRPRPADDTRGSRAGRSLPRFNAAEFEALLGRYGMLAIAVVAAVAAVGTFLNWAISHHYLTLTPTARVLVGLAFAGAIALWGFRLRRTERSFGSSLLGLALVIEQVCAYAAGPSFHLVPTIVAFIGAAGASWALALFAHAADDEPLWCVGFGGAALAPFVTSDGQGSVYALVAYGALVLLPASFAISHRDWRIGWRVFYMASALLVVASGVQARTAGTPGYMIALALPFAVAAGGVVPFAPASRKRGALRWMALLAVIVSFTRVPGESWVVASLALASVGVWLALLDGHAHLQQSTILERGPEDALVLDWIDAAAIPLLLIAPVSRLLGGWNDAAAACATATAAITLFAWRRAVNPLRDAAAFAAVILGLGVVWALPLELPAGRIAAIVTVGLAALALHIARPSRSWLAMGFGSIVLAASLATSGLNNRPPYQFPPFATEASAAALIAAVALAIVARFSASLRDATRASFGERPEATYAESLKRIAAAMRAAPWVWVFVWVVIELSMAYSPSTATLLLVIWFASTAVGCVAVGRARRASRLRQLGLGLALVAAAIAFFGAASYADFGVRIAIYLVTSAFLLGIAYWYRKRDVGDDATRGARPETQAP